MARVITQAQLTRLSRTILACENSELKSAREQRAMGQKVIAGSYYGNNGAKQKFPYNKLQLYMNTMLRLIVPRAPRPWIRSWIYGIDEELMSLQQNLAALSRKMRFAETLHKCAFDAHFFGGHVKSTFVHALDEGSGEVVARPNIAYVSFANWFHDTYALEPQRWQFCGDIYRLPMSVLTQDTEIDQDALKVLSSGTRKDGSKLTQEPGSDDEFDPTYILRDIYLPQEKCIVTTTYENTGIALKQKEWDGHPLGPYPARLSFLDLPDSSMPASIAMGLFDFNDAINAVADRNNTDAKNKKDLLVSERGNQTDVATINSATHRQAIGIQSEVKEVSFGGADARDMAFLQQGDEMFDQICGGLRGMAGLGPMAGTLGQEELIKGSSNVMVSWLGEKVQMFAADLYRVLAWYMVNVGSANGQELSYSTHRESPHGVSQSKFGDVERMILGGFDNLLIDVQPYSAEHTTPAGQYAKIMNFVQTVAVPLVPYYIQQGKVIDPDLLMDLGAKYLDAPELRLLFKMLPQAQQQLMQQQASGGGSGNPMPSTQPNGGTYNRVSSSSTPQSGKMIQSLLASKNAERASA